MREGERKEKERVRKKKKERKKKKKERKEEGKEGGRKEGVIRMETNKICYSFSPLIP